MGGYFGFKRSRDCRTQRWYVPSSSLLSVVLHFFSPLWLFVQFFFSLCSSTSEPVFLLFKFSSSFSFAGEWPVFSEVVDEAARGEDDEAVRGEEDHSKDGGGGGGGSGSEGGFRPFFKYLADVFGRSQEKEEKKESEVEKGMAREDDENEMDEKEKEEEVEGKKHQRRGRSNDLMGGRYA